MLLFLEIGERMNQLNSFEDYFNKIKSIWEPLGMPNKIIPFCTPLKINPNFLVIGLNHSNFDSNPKKAEQIGNAFSLNIPSVNTYIEHNHKFAKGLRAVIARVNEHINTFDAKPNENWVGTNRIAIQTGPEGADAVMKTYGYEECQKEMDRTLKSLIAFMRPKNILLVGNDACDGFYYPSNKEQKMENKKIKKVLINKDTREIANVIPLWHFSRGSFYQPCSLRIIEAIQNDFCDF